MTELPFTINGEEWRLQRRKLRTNYGVCHHDERRIVIDSRLKGEQELEVILHELDHAQHPHHGEDHVYRSAKDEAAVLYRLGYRLSKPRE